MTPTYIAITEHYGPLMTSNVAIAYKALAIRVLSTALRKSGIGSATAEINRGGGLGGLSERSVNLGQHLGERLRAPLEGVGVLVPLGDEGH